jgi:hypothetical protein
MDNKARFLQKYETEEGLKAEAARFVSDIKTKDDVETHYAKTFGVQRQKIMNHVTDLVALAAKVHELDIDLIYPKVAEKSEQRYYLDNLDSRINSNEDAWNIMNRIG